MISRWAEMSVAGSALPRHVAVIMDGNGRWAEAQGLPRLAGHREGAESVRAVTRECRKRGIAALTLYAFSAQNWLRPPDEVNGLMELLGDFLVNERPELCENNIRLQAIGNLSRLPASIQTALTETVRLTKSFEQMTLTLALSYDSRQDIVDACFAAAADANGKPTLDQVSRCLSTGDLPPVDLLIRTSGERRISNFILWELAYAELYFTDVSWPDFREASLDAALVDFSKRKRRFGKTDAQLAKEASHGPR